MESTVESKKVEKESIRKRNSSESSGSSTPSSANSSRRRSSVFQRALSRVGIVTKGKVNINK